MTTKKQIQTNRESAEEKNVKATKSRALVKKITQEELKIANEALVKRGRINPEELKLVNYYLKIMAYPGGDDPEKIVPKIAKVLLASYKTKRVNNEDLKEAIGTITKDINKALVVYGLETHFPFSQSVGEQLRPQVIEFSHQLIQDYDCKTSGEKALAELVVSAYARILLHSQRLNGAMSGESTKIGKQHIEYYLMLSKELDRANRHFITALTTLKQLKVPSLEISVKAKTAFVAQNQQINATNNPINKENEIIDPK